MKHKKLKYGGMSIVLTVLFLVGVVLLNIVVGLLVDRFYWKFDLTEGGIYELSEDTTGILRAIPEPVSFIVLAEESLYKNNYGYQQVHEILEKYAAVSGGLITVTYMDPNLNPSLAQQYSLVSLSGMDIIVESARRYTSINYLDLFELEYDSSSMSNYIKAFQAEQQLTNALLHVLNENTAKAIVITGHDEYRFEAFENYVRSSYYQLEEVDTRTSDIPGDATVVIISRPQGDYTEEEIGKLDAYLNAGGNILWLDAEQGYSRPNLTLYFKEWGITFEPSLVIEPEMSYPLNRFLIYSNVQAHDATAFVDSSSSLYFASYLASPIKREFETKDNRTTHSLVKTTNQSYARTPEDISTSTSFDKIASDVQGPFDLAVLSTQNNYIDGTTKVGSVLAIGGGALESQLVDVFSSSYLNGKFFTSVLNYMNPTSETVFIAAKAADQGTLQVTSGQGNVILVILIVIPVIILAMGIIVWRRRRHL